MQYKKRLSSVCQLPSSNNFTQYMNHTQTTTNLKKTINIKEEQFLNHLNFHFTKKLDRQSNKNLLKTIMSSKILKFRLQKLNPKDLNMDQEDPNNSHLIFSSCSSSPENSPSSSPRKSDIACLSPNTKKWIKAGKAIQAIVKLNKHRIKSITDVKDIDCELNDYKTRLYENTKRSKRNNDPNLCNEGNDVRDKVKEEFNMNSEDDLNKVIHDLFFEAITDIDINDTDKCREEYKENIEYQIMYNDTNPLKVIEEIYKYNPDRAIKTEKDKDFIFNMPIKKHGKTLIYLAVQEGKLDIVKYFLNKKLNPKITSELNDGTKESPLECACRWGYTEIIKLLLDNVSYTRKEINCVLKNKWVNENVGGILREYIEKRFGDKDSIVCFC